MRERHYTWKEFFVDIEKAANLLKKKNFKSLVLVSRGGLIPGAILARRLDICRIEVICIQSYQDHLRRKLMVYGKPFWKNKVKLDNPLIVDDICDSGETLRYLSTFVKAPVFTLFHKAKHAVFAPTYFLYQTSDWVVFPWE